MTEKGPRAIHTGELEIGNTTIACAVLEDGTRLLTQWDFYRAIGRSGRPAGGRGSDVEKVAPFLALDNLKPFVSNELADSTKPIVFRTPRGTKAYGYRAELLPKVCEVYLQAYDAGALLETQEKFAKACGLLMRGLAHVGIIALVDEATGYQAVRDKAALQEILDKYLTAEYAKWAKRFPDEFYREMFRLRGWQWKGMKVNRPSVVGHYTNDIVYDRIVPGSEMRKQLRELNPKNEKGNTAHADHQHFTVDLGLPRLDMHLYAVIGLMRASASWDQFMRSLQRAFPKQHSTRSLPFQDDSQVN
jgi:hypothetical protein